ncbi:mucin-6 isoform X1 [Drosophila subobscura]|uniref:mucin-6 isoform X1 n=1 Tax=Drosophila subobscura TaxID=7241 RepID=UPI00155A3E6F|nr:mucin-6 isoform X1 [Drosophila subobscura]
MAKDPATSRIPRLDGPSRIPQPGNFGFNPNTTSHIRPPTSSGNTLKATQIFRAPALTPAATAAKTRPASVYAASGGATGPLRDLGSSIKKSASGERINNAVSLLSKRTTTVLKKYFGNNNGMISSSSPGESPAPASVKPSPMTSSLPVTPMPGGKRAMVSSQQLTSSTPMPLLRSETFVCDEEEERKMSPHLNRTRLESTRISSMGFGQTMDMDSPDFNATQVLARDATRILKDTPKTMLDQAHQVMKGLAKMSSLGSPIAHESPSLRMPAKDATLTIVPQSLSPGFGKTMHVMSQDSVAASSTHIVNNSPQLGRTMPVIQAKDSTRTIACHSTGMGNLTKTIDAPGDVTKFIANGGNLTKSMDQLPLLEHMSMPSGLDAVASGKGSGATERAQTELDDTLDVTLTPLAPDRANMKLPLNSTLNTERLLDLSGLQSPARHIQLLNLTREFMEATPHRNAAQMGRRSIGQHTLLCLSPQSATTTPHGMRLGQQTPQPVHLLSPLLKQAQSEMVLPTRTPEAEGHATMENTLTSSRSRTRYSFGMDLPDSTLDCSIELVDNSFSSSQQQLQQLQQQLLKKQSSFDMDESLGILTPDQMKEFLDSPHNNLIHNMELQLAAGGHRMLHPNMQQLRMEQTPSPEELPLDPIEIKTEIVKQVEAAPQPPQVCTSAGQSKLSNSFITSVTSVTSLDTGYQGDGEMSRPASRGASDHSPSNGPHLGRVSRQPSFPPPIPAAAPAAPMRRQDPMTDSDFFTESDADDVLQRGDRRAQVIDGQLYGPTMQPSASVPQMEDSCMESSGIFTDVENRCDEEMRQPELEVDPDVDMSPDDSTQTMRKTGAGGQGQSQQQQQQQRPPSSCLSSSSAATTLSNRTSYCSVDGGSTKSFADEAFVPTAAVAASAGGECCRSSLGLSVQPTASPRPHASLSSLCTVETYRGSTSSSSSIASPKSCKALTTTTARSTNVSGTPRSSKSPRSGKASPASRKSHAPNKWDAVMNKIASNKPLIKTNYNDVKSKVSSTRAAMAAGQNSVQGSGSGSTPVQGSSNSVSKATTPSPRGSPSVSARRSPSATPKVVPRHPLVVKRSSSSSATSGSKAATPSPPPSTRQPQDKGSVVSGAGVGIRSSSKSPTSPTSPPTKRLQSTLINRGHSYSKDSHKSSHSDLRLLCSGDVTATATQAAASASGNGSPKLLAKTPLRAAKKRDVRNLSISPTDLGPPPKTQQTAKGQSTRSKSSATTTPTSIQKRLNGTSTAATPASASISNNTKGAATKSASPAATQIKQQSPQAKLKIACVKSSPIVKISEESLRSGVDQTELQELKGQSSNGCPTPPTPRDSKRASLSQESLCVCGAADIGCKCQTEPKLKKCECKPVNTPKQTGSDKQMLKQDAKDPQNIARSITSTNKSSDVTGKSCSSLTVLAHPRVDITIQYPALKPYTKNNVLDYDRLAEFFEANLNERQQEQRQMMGLAVMVQYMSQKLDACSCAETKEQCARDRSALEETIGLLQQTQRDCEELRQELHSKDVEWAQRQQEREHLHRTELKQAEEKVTEVQMLAKQRFCELEAQLRAKDEEHKLVQAAYQLEVSHKLALKQDQLTTAEVQIMDLQSRLQKAAVLEQELRDRLIRKKNIHTTSIHEGAQREQELNERIQSLTKELNTLRANTEYSERDLRDRLTLSQDEISVLRTSSQQRSPCTSNSTSLSDTSAELCRLTSEADSLRCVLELKQAEISTLSKENADLKREGEERLKLANQLDLLKSKNEMLQLELETKAEKEKETQQKLDELQKAYNHESMKRTRLTFDKEEMAYLLRTRTEKLHNAEARLQERSLSSQDGSHCFSRSTNESSSSPTSPMIKGMIERNDSISWTLEIDGETPKVSSAKMVRRNGSLRGSNERSPIQRRQQSISNGHANGHSSSSLRNGTASSAHRNGSSSSNGPNPLSQSMSATALMRGSHSLSGESESRTRSHSMCIKASASTSAVCEKRHTSDATLGGDLILPDWNEDPVCSSSPHPTLQSEMRPRSSTMKLMSSEANALKKFQEIQESAGEAMVSGANSEDESCSASSEDMMRSSTSSTASVGSLSKRPKQPSSRMSIEEALPCTPMEVSWSEDAADAEAEA